MRDFGVPLFRASSELLLKDHSILGGLVICVLFLFRHTFVNTLAVGTTSHLGVKRNHL